ncbi:MAG: phosphoribosylaminoimidazolesuccinocarboxamide synthase [Bacteroidota bacterium]
MNSQIILQTELPGLQTPRRGKVRDVYDLGDQLLIVSTDRISAFDWVLPNGIPQKGRVLTQISAFWFRKLSDVVKNHLLSSSVEQFPETLREHRETLAGRSMLVMKAKVVPIECVVRGYLAGSGWKEYQKSASVCGIALPEGLQQCSPLPHPIFTPATKEETGHDMNISEAEMARRIGFDLTTELRDISLKIYTEAANFALAHGIIIADTKFEFGLDTNGAIVWIDEALTPDSSRFWPKDQYQPGRDQPSFDKQGVRNHLETTGWDKQSPPPSLPNEIVTITSRKYLEVSKLLMET